MSLLDYVKDLFNNPAKYTKFWIALVTALLSALSTAIPDSPYLPIVIQFVGAFGVFALPNKNVR